MTFKDKFFALVMSAVVNLSHQSITGMTYVDHDKVDEKYRNEHECDPFYWHPLHLPPHCAKMYDKSIRSKLSNHLPIKLIKERSSEDTKSKLRTRKATNIEDAYNDLPDEDDLQLHFNIAENEVSDALSGYNTYYPEQTNTESSEDTDTSSNTDTESTESSSDYESNTRRSKMQKKKNHIKRKKHRLTRRRHDTDDSSSEIRRPNVIKPKKDKRPKLRNEKEIYDSYESDQSNIKKQKIPNFIHEKEYDGYESATIKYRKRPKLLKVKDIYDSYESEKEHNKKYRNPKLINDKDRYGSSESEKENKKRHKSSKLVRVKDIYDSYESEKDNNKKHRSSKLVNVKDIYDSYESEKENKKKHKNFEMDNVKEIYDSYEAENENPKKHKKRKKLKLLNDQEMYDNYEAGKKNHKKHKQTPLENYEPEHSNLRSQYDPQYENEKQIYDSYLPGQSNLENQYEFNLENDKEIYDSYEPDQLSNINNYELNFENDKEIYDSYESHSHHKKHKKHKHHKKHKALRTNTEANNANFEFDLSKLQPEVAAPTVAPWLRPYGRMLDMLRADVLKDPAQPNIVMIPNLGPAVVYKQAISAQSEKVIKKIAAAHKLPKNKNEPKDEYDIHVEKDGKDPREIGQAIERSATPSMPKVKRKKVQRKTIVKDHLVALLETKKL